LAEDFSRRSNVQLVQAIAREPGNELAWREFIQRFHKDVCRTIYYQRKELGYATDSAHVEDLAQEVYVKLLHNDCRALRNFRSDYEHAIHKYLKKTAISVVYTDYQRDFTIKRQPPGGKVSLDAMMDLGIIPPAPVDSSGLDHIKSEIKDCLDTILRESRHATRDRLIMKFRIFEGFKPEEIISHLGFKISLKRIANIIAEILPELRQCLSQKGILG
jgi:RNA polymerase sigma factor (sigma-70 family)